MVFSSILFLFVFLPTVLLLYFIVNRRTKNIILLIASLLFYAYGEGGLVMIMIVSIIWNFFIGISIHKFSQSSKWVLAFGIVGNLGLLVYYKYINFIINNLQLANLLNNYNNESIILPIGISFFTFQSISYLIDVYRKDSNVQRNILHLGLYISLFPQLIAGPIIRYHDVASQILNRSINIAKFYEGMCRFIRGLAKKVIIANNMALIADSTFNGNPSELSAAIAWIGILAYTLQIYYDFSGYSDMAIGLGKMFGFDFLENFNYPYIAQSVQDFWRRWHISLSTWFRDYVYISLGGNRLGSLRTYTNLFIVFFITGLWHGASWSFVVWGLYHGLFLIIERIGFGAFLKKLPTIIRHGYLLFVVLIGWVFFRSPDLNFAMQYIESLFNFSSGLYYIPLLYFNEYTLTLIPIALMFIGPLREWIKSKLIIQPDFLQTIPYLRGVGYLILFAYCATELAQDTYNPFIYFRF